MITGLIHAINSTFDFGERSALARNWIRLNLFCAQTECATLQPSLRMQSEAFMCCVKWLRLNGVGYKALLIADGLGLSLGFGHELMFDLSHDAKATVFRANKLKLGGANLDPVAAAASVLKAKKRANVYKAKSVMLRKVWG
ncbi:MAG: 50S ribosomal protein L6 [Candidatus Hodgkinia cicadicola]|nr:MAG: 50S ribosomal protein L6 [Candidatus Hodgkinia cicadicola]